MCIFTHLRLEFKRESVPVTRDSLLTSHRSVSAMVINSSGTTILLERLQSPRDPQSPRRKKTKMTQGYILCSGNIGGFLASEGGSCHRGFTIVSTILYLQLEINLPQEKCLSVQEPLNAPFLNGLFSRGFSRGKTAH